MRDKRSTLSILAILAMVLLLATSLTAILWDDGGDPYPFTTPRGEQVEIYGGTGPYQFDNTYKAIAFRSFDWANLVVVLPLLAFTSFMVFVALSVSLFLFYVSFGRGGVLDMAITTVIAVVATGFSFVIFKRVQD